MIKRKFNKYLMLIGAVVLSLAIVLPLIAAYEGHTIDVRAHVKGDTRGTRTPGYWRNHVDAAKWVLENSYGGVINIGWPEPCTDITNINDLLGVFWSCVPKNSDGSDRSPLCQAKRKAAFQVLAAVLTAGTSNGKALPVTIDDIRLILSGTNITAIDNLQILMDAHNNSAEDYPLCVLYENTKICDEKAKDMADIPFADCDNSLQCSTP